VNKAIYPLPLKAAKGHLNLNQRVEKSTGIEAEHDNKNKGPKGPNATA
jgi:hypothetical protein